MAGLSIANAFIDRDGVFNYARLCTSYSLARTCNLSPITDPIVFHLGLLFAIFVLAQVMDMRVKDPNTLIIVLVH